MNQCETDIYKKKKEKIQKEKYDSIPAEYIKIITIIINHHQNNNNNNNNTHETD